MLNNKPGKDRAFCYGAYMNSKTELREAKERAKELKDAGLFPEQIVRKLNIEFEGFYYVRNGAVLRGNDIDYLPDTPIVAL